MKKYASIDTINKTKKYWFTMRNDLETFIITYSPYWLTALLGVALQKMYAKEQSSTSKVLRSAVSAIGLSTFIVVVVGSDTKPWVLFTNILMLGLSVDFIVPELARIASGIVLKLFKTLTGDKS